MTAVTEYFVLRERRPIRLLRASSDGRYYADDIALGERCVVVLKEAYVLVIDVYVDTPAVISSIRTVFAGDCDLNGWHEVGKTIVMRAETNEILCEYQVGPFKASPEKSTVTF